MCFVAENYIFHDFCYVDYLRGFEFLRKNGQINAIKKSSRETKDGIISYQKDENYLVFIKLLCETDFVAKNSIFLSLAKNITSLLLKNPTLSIEELMLRIYELEHKLSQ